MTVFYSQPICECTLPISLTNRNIGQGGSWYKSAAERKRFEQTLYLDYRRDRPFDHPVVLTICRRVGTGQRVWDTDAVAIASKQLIDTLVSPLGWFTDDSYKYIRAITYTQDVDHRAKGPAVIVTVYRAEVGDE